MTRTFCMTIRARIGKEYPMQYEDVPVNVTVELDVEQIAWRLAAKAFQNAKGVSKLGVGIKVTAKRVTI